MNHTTEQNPWDETKRYESSSNAAVAIQQHSSDRRQERKKEHKSQYSASQVAQASVPASATQKVDLVSQKNDIPNIVVFGETGTGKSSLINMLSGTEVARTSSAAVGETFSSKGYDIVINGEDVPNGARRYRLWDTAGMNEGNKGTVPAEQALDNLRQLVLSLEGGVNLLLYCIRGGRYKDIIRVNYDMFQGIICQGKVPVVLVITGLEHEDPMESWWAANGAEYEGYGLKLQGHACVTTSMGKKMKDETYMFEDEYKQSEAIVRQLIVDKCSPVGWSLKGQEWIKQIGWRMQEYMHQFNQRSGKERVALEENYEGGGSGRPHSKTKSSWNPVQWVRGHPTPATSSRQVERFEPQAPRQAAHDEGSIAGFFNGMLQTMNVPYQLTRVADHDVPQNPSAPARRHAYTDRERHDPRGMDQS